MTTEGPANPGDDHYILCLKGGPFGDMMTWWAPNNNGYTISLDQAGRYSAEKVASHPSYYDDGVNTKAIPCHLAEEAAHRIVPFRSQLVLDWGGVYDHSHKTPKGHPKRPWPYWPEATGQDPTKWERQS